MTSDVSNHITALRRRCIRIQALFAFAFGLLLVGFGGWVMAENGWLA